MANKYGDVIGVAVLAVAVLLIGLFQVFQPGGATFGDLTGGIVTFSTMVRIGILTIVIVGLNMLMGYAGQISLGQAAFYGMGAYASAVFSTRPELFGLPESLVAMWWWPWVVILAAMGFTGLFAYLVGRPILRLKGHYLAMATLGLGIMVYILFRENFGFRTTETNITGGYDGLFDVPRLAIGGFSLWPVERYYFFVWAIALIVIVLAMNMVKSRPGRALRAIHSSEIAAETMGVDTASFKVQVFVISAVFASLAGSLYAHFQAAVSPAPFSFEGSLDLVVMAAVGGMASVWGAPFGVATILVLEDLLRARLDLIFEGASGEIEVIVFGGLLVLIMIFMPEGVFVGIRNRINAWREERAGAAGDALPEQGAAK
ncbi:MAG: branched-chain amino acid ABC transporter permease [Chloroflexi bacterium]|nr:branched-chain amino acid ABC transporter permease [Chloroflexota bacterium]